MWTNWFSEPFQSSTKTLFWPKLLRRRQDFEKTSQKGCFRQFLENFQQKIIIHVCSTLSESLTKFSFETNLS